ncbi:MAG: flagellar FlbD family protein [Clostridiales bacterium]|nr:flagellar FlbD family protein [Clostridiales bacterium]
MIKLKRLNNKELILNSELIEYIERTPDTIITLVNGNKIVVLETPEEVVDKIVDYKRRIHNYNFNKVTLD